MNRQKLSLIAAVTKKRSTVPVFMIYAGIIHAIGLALLMPMLITLPGPGTEGAPKATAIDVEIIPASQSPSMIEPEEEQTSALPSGEPAAEDEGTRETAPGVADSEAGPDADKAGDVANVSPEARPESPPEDEKAAEREEPAGKAKENARPAKAKSAKVAPAIVKKPVAQRAKSYRPPANRTARAKPKPIRPFDGALSGLFAPAPAAKRY